TLLLSSCINIYLQFLVSAQILTLTLHAALPISRRPPLPPPRSRARSRGGSRRSGTPRRGRRCRGTPRTGDRAWRPTGPAREAPRSEEHTSELQSRENIVCRLLLEKKNRIL